MQLISRHHPHSIRGILLIGLPCGKTKGGVPTPYTPASVPLPLCYVCSVGGSLVCSIDYSPTYIPTHGRAVDGYPPIAYLLCVYTYIQYSPFSTPLNHYYTYVRPYYVNCTALPSCFNRPSVLVQRHIHTASDWC